MSRGWRDLQATTLVGAVRRALSTSPREDAGPRDSAAVGDPGRAVTPWRGRSLPAVPAGEGMGADVAAAVRTRALAAGLPAVAAEALEERWHRLSATARHQVATPLLPAHGSTHLEWGTDVAVQTDGTTCGAASLAMLAAAGDPGLALWLATGEELPGYVPPEVRFLRRIRPGALLASPQRRFAAVQRTIKYVTNRLGAAPWPDSLGTPPWGAVRAARFGPVRYRAEMVDDGDPSGTADQLARAAGALDAGIPVPLYVQGDVGGGLAAAVPRHVVLLTALRGTEELAVYEPGSGLSAHIARADLIAPRGPRRALGGWTHAAWILLPRRGSRADARGARLGHHGRTSRAKEVPVSTVPGAESWRDAGLAEPDVEEPVTITSADESPEDYDPEPDPVLGTREANEADVVEQLDEVPVDEGEDYL